MEKELQKLGNAIKRLEKPILDVESKSRLKANIFMQMKAGETQPSSISRLSNKIRVISQIIAPTSIVRARMKENVFAMIEKTRQTKNFFHSLFANWQKATASALIFLLTVTSFLVYVADIPMTRAAKSTFFQKVYGNVQIMRDGQRIEAFIEMPVYEGDIIITGEDGIAFVRYFDDSITRLSPLTELRVSKLYQDEEDSTQTQVEVQLEQGRVWSQVVNLVDDKSIFQVTADDVTASTSQKASFDVQTSYSTKSAQVTVFDNEVSIDIDDKKQNDDEKLGEGYKLEVQQRTSKTKIVSVKEYEQDTEDDIWVSINTIEDFEYKQSIEDEVSAQRTAEAGHLPNEPLYAAKKLNESAKMLATGDETEKSKFKVDLAKKRLLEASALLSDEQPEEAEKILEEFDTLVDEIAEESVGSDELEEYVEMVLDEETRDLSLVAPDSPLYPVKESVRDAKETLAETPEEKTEVLLETASEKLDEAETLIEEEKEGIAIETLEGINVDLDEMELSKETAEMTTEVDDLIEEALHGSSEVDEPVVTLVPLEEQELDRSLHKSSL